MWCCHLCLTAQVEPHFFRINTQLFGWPFICFYFVSLARKRETDFLGIFIAQCYVHIFIWLIRLFHTWWLDSSIQSIDAIQWLVVFVLINSYTRKAFYWLEYRTSSSNNYLPKSEIQRFLIIKFDRFNNSRQDTNTHITSEFVCRSATVCHIAGPCIALWGYMPSTAAFINHAVQCDHANNDRYSILYSTVYFKLIVQTIDCSAQWCLNYWLVTSAKARITRTIAYSIGQWSPSINRSINTKLCEEINFLWISKWKWTHTLTFFLMFHFSASPDTTLP